MRPFSSGPIWGSEEKNTEVQEDHVSSSTTSFAITLGEGKQLTRDDGPKVRCSFDSIKKQPKFRGQSFCSFSQDDYYLRFFQVNQYCKRDSTSKLKFRRIFQ